MQFKDILNTIIIIILIFSLLVASFSAVGMKNIQNNWPKYRCNPAIMPFAKMFGHDPEKNLVFCIQNMQKNFMGYLLEPIHFSHKVLHEGQKQSSGAINEIRKFFSYLRDAITSVVSAIYGVFLNTIIQFQKVIINFKDLVEKLIGVTTTFLFLIEGAIKTGQSFANGPIVKTIKKIPKL